MGKFITIGERIHCISPVIRAAMESMDREPVLKRAGEQISAGAVYLDLNIGPAEKNGEELMIWAVKLLQENFENVPLCLDTVNKKAIEAGLSVYNNSIQYSEGRSVSWALCCPGLFRRFAVTCQKFRSRRKEKDLCLQSTSCLKNDISNLK